MTQKFNKGDQVEWKTGNGTTTGTIETQITKPTEIDGNHVAASENEPRYLVKNDNTGHVTGHKPETLKKITSNTDNSNTDNSNTNNSDREQQIKAFKEVVNMTATELEKWLDTEESQSVGQKEEDGEAIGHKSGKRIIELLRKKKADYTEDDLHQMSRVVSYVRRHSAQKPSGDIENTNWRYSLMNWGNDPLK
ncbi:HVA1 family protein [Capilliphycus salinus ALCB114379]|uniref:HVA1 family protein n=1 Tax=Capilliphycus salinus TaxID=2768948 RepID=UPI0039A51D52